MNSSIEFAKIKNESNTFQNLQLFEGVHITPELARELLALNTDNRPIKKPLVKKYADEMINNNWFFTGEPISINTNANINNGQHRLMGIVDSNTTQIMNIQCGLDPNSFNVIDTGANRTGKDTLAMKGYTQCAIVATLVRYVTAYKNNSLIKLMTNPVKLSNFELCAFAEDLDRELLQRSATIAAKFYKQSKFMEVSTFGSIYYLLQELNPEKADDFFHKLSTGDGIGLENHPSIHLLRNKLISSSLSGYKINIKHRWALVTKAWNLYLSSKPVLRLRYAEDEDYPTLMAE